MKSIFDHVDYKEFINQWIESMPNGGHGEYRKLALALGVSTTMVSQVFRGDKHLSMELAEELGEYLGLDEEESFYLLLLVEFARAGSYKLQSRLKARIMRIQREARQLDKRLKKDAELSQSAKATFYSHYLYSACRLLCDIESLVSVNDLSDHLRVPRQQIMRIVDFLLQFGLVKKEQGQLKIGPARTHLGATDPLVSRHHQNWRLLGIQRMHGADEESLFATFPMGMSKAVAEEIRRDLPTFIESVTKRVLPSKTETVRCLNIDWFEV